MCEFCGVQPKYPGHAYCSKTCGTTAALAKEATQQIVSGLGAPVHPRLAPSNSTTGNSSTASGQNMCLNCRAKPKFQGHDYCGKTCADWAKANRDPTPQPASTPIPPPQVPGMNSTTPGPSSNRNNCVITVGSSQSFEVTTIAAKSQENAVAQTSGASGPPPDSAVAGTNSPSSSSPAVANPPAASTLCEHCFKYVKSREMEDDGTITTHSYCGIGCYKASQHSAFSSSMVPTPAAASGSQHSSMLRIERINTPVGRKILHMVQQRWQSEIARAPQVEGIYRIDLAANIYRRFDLAL
ncbi:hypothetical protein FRC01_004143, partial [Tulasnella sp. 417]